MEIVKGMVDCSVYDPNIVIGCLYTSQNNKKMIKKNDILILILLLYVIIRVRKSLVQKRLHQTTGSKRQAPQRTVITCK